ncbi:MAG: polyhydroxyalkanoate depolymerase [Candidatus Berkiellales bacterium]
MLFNPIDNRWLYNIADTSFRMMKPLSDYYLTTSKQINRVADLLSLPGKMPFSPFEERPEIFNQYRYLLRKSAATLYVAHMLTDTYHKPEFGIEEVKIGDTYHEVTEKIIMKKSFCNLINFSKSEHIKPMPKILLVAPMSGHYATLLRGTVTDLLPHYDVYITDWKSARNVPLSEGSFDLDEFAQYMITFMHKLGPDLHVMAVCQSTVPTLVALSLMSADQDPKLPKTAILLGGPIDTDQAPTTVNELATSRGDDWFKQNVISIVPSRHKGYMRLVYPGFMQLSGFMSMNLQRHIQSLQKAIEDFATDNVHDALKIVNFYAEYFATMDLTAEFYMQTINTVFQQKLLTKGRFKTRGRYANLQDIKQTAILAIEGEKDDITGVGQTKSVLSLCKDLPDSMKKYFLAENVGHYGLFNGSKFRKVIVPEILKFTQAQKIH